MFVAEALSVPLMPSASKGALQAFSMISTDSRKIQPGALFVAIQGEKFDGHEFIGDVIKKGAWGILCRRDFKIAEPKGLHIFPVENPLNAYRRLAGHWRKQFSVPVIAVAGSVGKTSTKELLTAALRGRFGEVLRTQGSQNGFVGIPMTLLELRPSHEVAVVEVGIDEPGTMEQHMALVAPTTSVLTTIGPEHLEKLRDVPTVAREEGIALTSVAQSGGTIAVNLDDPWIRPHFNTLKTARKIGYTLDRNRANTYATDLILIGSFSDSGTLSVSHPDLGECSFKPPLPGRHNALNLMAAIAVSIAVGLTFDQIKKGLKTFEPPDGRSELREFSDGTQVVCDYYNANPDSMEAGLELLTDIARKKSGKSKKLNTRWACLADMLELGPDEDRFHRELAGPLMRLKIENILLFGPRMKSLRDELSNRGFQGSVDHFEKQSELTSRLISGVHSGDAILIKGSHSMKMEDVWKKLRGSRPEKS